MALFTVTTPFDYLVTIGESEHIGGSFSSLQDIEEDSKLETFAMIFMWELKGHMKRLQQQHKEKAVESVRIRFFQAIF